MTYDHNNCRCSSYVHKSTWGSRSLIARSWMDNVSHWSASSTKSCTSDFKCNYWHWRCLCTCEDDRIVACTQQQVPKVVVRTVTVISQTWLLWHICHDLSVPLTAHYYCPQLTASSLALRQTQINMLLIRMLCTSGSTPTSRSIV